MKTILASELKELLASETDLVLIDVLSEDSFGKGHVPGAINVPINEEFVSKVSEKVSNKDTHIVVYCSSKQCGASPAAAKQLTEAGFSNVSDYEDGIQGWKDSGYKLEGSGDGKETCEVC
jgi:rhodanese-related sulfurtransferase